MWNTKLYININYLIILILFINNAQASYIHIPFKIYKNQEPSAYSSIEDYFFYQTELQYYGQISIGEQETPIPIILSFDDFGFYLITKGTDLGNIISSYNCSSSPSCKQEPFSYIFFKSFNNATKANDTIIFNTDTNNPLKCKNIKFLYAFLDNKKKNTFLMVGLRLVGDIIRDSELNLVQQLKKNKYTDTYDWSIHYDEKNPENEGILLIGTQPHNYNPKKYNQNYYFNSVTVSKEIYGLWYIQFDKIFFLNNEEEIQINDFMKFSLKHKSGIIAGTSSYEKLLNKYFFYALISEQKCWMETSKLNSRVYICKNTIDIKNELKEKFPTLKMTHKAFMKTFELTYDDLFKEKGDKIYFLIYFSYYQTSTWEAGLPFLKKYTFNYNYDSKLISYYNNDLEDMEKNKENEGGNSKIKAFVIIGLIIIITVLGFYLGRKYVLMRRRQKLNAKELENEFSKQISGSQYLPPINEKENSKYRLI